MAWWKKAGQDVRGGKAASRPQSRLLLQALEPRLMFDGAVAASVAEATHAIAEPHDVAAAQPRHGEAAPPAVPAIHESAASAASARDSRGGQAANAPQVVFVESDVANLRSLLAQLPAGYQVVILDSSKDGLAQIAQWASMHHGYGAIHIISHGQENDLQLGGVELTTANVASRQADLATIGQALRPGGDILLYGCDVAEGHDGAALINAIARESGRTTAGSTDATGAASLGGDWTLEYSTDRLHVAALNLADYHGLLTRPTSGTTTFDSQDGSTTVVPTGVSSLTVSNVLGWNFTMQMNSNSDGQNEMIIIEKDGASSVETVDALSDGVKQINYFSVKPNDGSLFTLNSITVVINGYDSTFNGGTMQLVGYLNGSAVAGATLSQSVSDIDNDGSPVTFNVSSNSNFQGIDSFRVLAANGHNITGLLGIGAINATNFHFPGPTLTASGGSSAYSSGTGSAVTVDSGITLSDTAASTQTSATVSITGNFHSGEDVLAFTNNGSTMGNISGSYNSGTGVLTLTSSGSTATNAQWQAALEAVTYRDSSLTPNTSSRTISFAITDASSNTSSTVTKTVSVAADSAPVIGNLNGDSSIYYAGNGAVHLDTGAAATVSDTDTSNFNGGNVTVHISANGHGAEDALGIDTGGAVALSSGTSVGSTVSVGGVAIGTIAASGDGVSGHDLIVSLNSYATAGRVTTLVDALTYNNTAAGIPNTSTRTIQVTVNDGRGGTSSAASVAMAVSAAPALAVTGGSAAFTAGDNAASTPVAVDGGITVTDNASPTLASGTVSITGNFHSGEDVLSFTNNGSTMGNIVASYNSGTGVLTLTSSGATATLAQWQAALRAVAYTDSAVTPNTATRTISFQVVDGSSNSSAATTRTVTVAATDQTPVATASSGSAAFTAGDNVSSTPVAVDSGLNLSDLDNTTLASATVSITGNFHSGEDVLSFTNTSAITYGNIVASYNSGTGVLTLTSSGATATLAQWQAALRAVKYTDSAVTPNTATRTVSFVVNDGTKSSAATTRAVTVAATDQTPVATASGGSAAFTAGDNAVSTPVAVDSGLTLSDLDNATLASATVAITGNFHSGEDVLSFTNNGSTMGNIVASYNSGTGVLTLTSSGATATLAQWQAALRAVAYTDSAITPNTTTRMVSFMVNDGSKDSAAATRTITVAATDQTPIATVSGASGSYTISGAPTPVAVDGGIALSDLDNATLASATVSITGNFHSGEDVLAFTNSNASAFGNIVASYNSGTGVLTLSSSGATATLAQWQAALRAVTYNDTAVSPSTATRVISFVVNDGIKNSAAATRNMAIQLPTPTVSGLTAGTDTGSSNTDGRTSDHTPTVTGTAEAGSTVTIYVDGVAVDSTTANGSGAWSYSFAVPLSDGAHAITVMASSGGVNSSLSGACNVAIDTAAPSAPSSLGLSAATDTGSSHGDGVTNNAQPTLTGSAEANSTVTVYLDGTAVGTATTDGSGAWSYSLTSPLADGNHSVRATSTDAAGNVSGQSAAYVVTVDTAAPDTPTDTSLTVATDSGSSDRDGITNVNRPSLTGHAEAGSKVTVFIDGAQAGVATADGNGVWLYNLTQPLADGQHSVRAAATDLAGNVSAQSSSFTLTVDTSAPALQTFARLDPATGSASSLRYDLVFNKPIVGLSASDLRLIASGGASGSIGNIVRLSDSHYVVQLTGISGAGSVALALRSGAAADLAGNVTQRQVVGPAYQLATSANVVIPVTPPVETAPQSSPAPVINVGPITPNIVLAAVSDAEHGGAQSMPAIGLSGPLTGNAIQIPFGQDPFPPAASISRAQGSVGLPFVSSLGGPAGAALQVLPDLGVRPLTAGQSFNFSLPAGTVISRNTDAVLNVQVRQSNGQPLPAWLKFDPQTGRFSGTPPAGWSKSLSLEVTVSDQDGHRGVTHMQLKAGAERQAAAAATENAELAGKPALSEQFSQHGKPAFDEQVAAWLQAGDVA
ncbi:sulfurtransferase [Xenophilus sp. AP218F]|nr:sulfurtransferase [Xenophilus sp. AP218F]